MKEEIDAPQQGSDFLERINKYLLSFYDKEILRNVTSQDCLDFLNTTNQKDFYEIFWKLDPMGVYSLPNDGSGTPEDWQDIKNARKSVEDFARSKVGRRFMETQDQLRKAVETKAIYNLRWHDSILGVTLKPSVGRDPSINITRRDPCTLIFTRVVVEIIKGERIGKCKAGDCNKFYIAYKSGKPQKYCSTTCRKRDFQKRQREKDV